MKNDLKFLYDDANYITYRKYGCGNTAIVFLHGFASAKDSWYELANLFDKAKYTLYLLDLKGFGNASIPRDKQYSMKDNADIITSFINRIIATEYIIAGNSFGGGVCLILATENKLIKQPKAQILIDSAAYDDRLPFFVEILRNCITNYMLFRFTIPALRARFVLNRICFKGNITKQMIETYTQLSKGKGKIYSFRQTARQIVPSDEDYDKLILKYSAIKLPTLIIWGRNDRSLPASQGARLHNQIKHSRLEVVGNCGHLPQEEKPELVYEIIKKFLAEKMP